MKRAGRIAFVSIASLIAVALTGCASDSLSRGVYEGSQVYNESLKSTPMEKSKGDPVTYDQYEKERQKSSTDRSR